MALDLQLSTIQSEEEVVIQVTRWFWPEMENITP